MIVFDLCCSEGHRFEGWFGSSHDFTEQSDRGLLICPECASVDVMKAPMAPAVGVKSNQTKVMNSPGSKSVPARAELTSKPLANAPMPAEVAKAMSKLAKLQAAALKDSTYVGKSFAEKSRAMHYGEEDQSSIHGEATLQEAKELIEEGVEIAPLPFPVAPPEDLN